MPVQLVPSVQRSFRCLSFSLTTVPVTRDRLTSLPGSGGYSCVMASGGGDSSSGSDPPSVTSPDRGEGPPEGRSVLTEISSSMALPFPLFRPQLGFLRSPQEGREPGLVNGNPLALGWGRTQAAPDQRRWTPTPPEDLSHHFTDEELEQAVEKKYLSFVANSCDQESNWRRLARKIKLDSPSLTRIEMLYGEHVRDFIYQMLVAWKQRNPEVRVRDLVKLLSESKLPSGALELKKLFSSFQWVD